MTSAKSVCHSAAAFSLYCAAAGGSLSPGNVLAQTAVEAPPPQAVEASLSHAVLKGVTLKALSFTAGVAIFSWGTGSLLAGGSLSAVNAACT